MMQKLALEGEEERGAGIVMPLARLEADVRCRNAWSKPPMKPLPSPKASE